MTDALIQYVKDNPEVETVYFKDAKETEWTLQPDNNHPIAKSRADVIGSKAFKAEVKDGLHAPEASQLEPERSVDLVISDINLAINAAEADQAAAGDTRVAVVNALDEKKKSFSVKPKAKP